VLRKCVTRMFPRNLQKECSPISNGDDSSKSLCENFFNNEGLQENFSDIKSLLENFSDRNQHINDNLECSLSMTSDTSSNNGQATDTEKFKQVIADSRIDFQPLSGEYGPYFKNFMRYGELWLSEMTNLIDPLTVIGLVTVWLYNTPKPPDYQFNAGGKSGTANCDIITQVNTLNLQ
ncbi:12209_t:CDS:2, partial [Racocetra fulgida]